MAAFDVVVLGGGTAGVHVATEVAAGGKTVALVEAGLIGGESAYLACLPSNSLLLSATRGEPWEDAVARRAEVTGGLDDSAPAQRLRRAGVQVIRGTGRITAPGTVEVTLASRAQAARPPRRHATTISRWPIRTWLSRPAASRSRRRSRACPTYRPGPPRRACARPTCPGASSCSAAGPQDAS